MIKRLSTDSTPLLSELMKTDDKFISNLLDVLGRTLVLDERKQTISINLGIDPALDNLKRVNDNLENLINMHVSEEYKLLPRNSHVKSIGITYIHEEGYLIYVPREIEALYEVEEDRGHTMNRIKSSVSNYSGDFCL
jgi:hypothetical protein